jgi:hypothetical protein
MAMKIEPTALCLGSSGFSAASFPTGAGASLILALMRSTHQCSLGDTSPSGEHGPAFSLGSPEDQTRARYTVGQTKGRSLSPQWKFY